MNKVKKVKSSKKNKYKKDVLDEDKNIVEVLYELKQKQDLDTIRRYQAERNYNMDPEAPNVIDQYMELLVQFGFVAIFSFAFPLAPLLSLLCNIM